MKIAKTLAAVLWMFSLPAIRPAAGQDVPVEAPAAPQQPTTREQMKQIGGQLLMSLFDRIVQGKAQPVAASTPTEGSEEPVESPPAEPEPIPETTDDPETQPAPQSSAMLYDRIRLRPAGAASQQVSRLPKSR